MGPMKFKQKDNMQRTFAVYNLLNNSETQVFGYEKNEKFILLKNVTAKFPNNYNHTKFTEI
jgi:hypothetical protein